VLELVITIAREVLPMQVWTPRPSRTIRELAESPIWLRRASMTRLSSGSSSHVRLGNAPGLWAQVPRRDLHRFDPFERSPFTVGLLGPLRSSPSSTYPSTNPGCRCTGEPDPGGAVTSRKRRCCVHGFKDAAKGEEDSILYQAMRQHRGSITSCRPLIALR
jgi:hypothetical protein